jgi:hypothetical protein
MPARHVSFIPLNLIDEATPHEFPYFPANGSGGASANSAGACRLIGGIAQLS